MTNNAHERQAILEARRILDNSPPISCYIGHSDNNLPKSIRLTASRMAQGGGIDVLDVERMFKAMLEAHTLPMPRSLSYYWRRWVPDILRLPSFGIAICEDIDQGISASELEVFVHEIRAALRFGRSKTLMCTTRNDEFINRLKADEVMHACTIEPDVGVAWTDMTCLVEHPLYNDALSVPVFLRDQESWFIEKAEKSYAEHEAEMPNTGPSLHP